MIYTDIITKEHHHQLPLEGMLYAKHWANTVHGAFKKPTETLLSPSFPLYRYLAGPGLRVSTQLCWNLELSTSEQVLTIPTGHAHIGCQGLI